MKNQWVRVLLLGVVIFFTAMVTNTVLAWFLPQLQTEYQNPALFRAMNDPLMTYLLVHPFIWAFVLNLIWVKTISLIKEKNIWKRAFYFAWPIALIVLPGILITYACFPISLLMILSWIKMSFAEIAVASLVLSAMER